MLSINGTTNYSTARIDGVIFTDSNTEIEKIKQDITDITYNNVTDTTNIANNVDITKDLDVAGNVSVAKNIDVGGNISLTGLLNISRLNVGANANVVSQFGSISVGDNYGKIQVSNYSTNRASLVLENKTGGITQGITIQGPSSSSETFNVAFTKTPAQNLFSASRTTFTINTGELLTQKTNTPLIVQPDYNFATPNEMTNITMYDDSVLRQSGTGVIRQTGTQENYLKATNITQTKTDVALLGYETDEFINKDAALRRYYPFDNTLGTGARFNNFNKYFVDGTYPASSMTNTGTLTFSSQIGQIGLNSIQYTSGRYFFNYFGNPDFLYDCNFMSFGGWVKATTSATSSRLFFINVSGTSAFIILDVDVGGSMYLAGDTTTFNTVSVATGTNAIWYHVFVVIDGTSQKVYRNGTLISTTTRPATFTGTSEATFGFGRDTSVMGTSNVDDLRLYSRSLTNAEVLAVYNYRGALREPWAVKMNGTVMLGDRIDAEYATRSFNVRSQDGIISIGRYSNSQPGFELLNFDPDTGVQRSNVLFLGGAAAEYATMLMRTGGEVFPYYVYRTQFDCQVSMRVRGAEMRIDGGITQATSTSTNAMRGITMYADQTLTQSGTGIISQSGTGTNALKNTSITGTLAITGYPDVKAALDTASSPAALTGITYNSGTDTTTIDNNLKVNKNLTLQDNRVVLTAPTGYLMDECEKHTYLYSINRTIGSPYRMIRTTSMEAVDAANDFSIGQANYVFQLIKIIKGVTYTGAFIINSSVGTAGHNAQMALFEAGIGTSTKPLARLAVTEGFTTANSTLHYVPFRTPYTPPESINAYIGIIVTTVSLNPVLRGQTINYWNRYGITSCQTGSLTSLCCGYGTSVGNSFDTMGTSLPYTQAMTAYGTQLYCGLYTDE